MDQDPSTPTFKVSDHDLNSAVFKIRGLIDLLESGYDFEKEEAEGVLKCAREAIALIEGYIRDQKALLRKS